MMMETLSKAIGDIQKAGDPQTNRFSNTEVKVKRKGKEIILPDDPVPMHYKEAITVLQRIEKEEEMEVQVNETVDAFPFDGAYAFMKAMKEIYGWASATPTVIETFFGKVEKPPVTISIEIDQGKFTQIIWGDFMIPGIEGVLTTGATTKDSRWIFCIKGKVKKKYQMDVAAIAEKTREIVKRESIYRCKAIKLVTDDEGKMQMNTPPAFLDLSRVNADELTFSDEVQAQVQTNLFTPIEYTTACRMHQIPLKRGVLLEGPFGTGKTLTAFVTAQKARDNGWTFILIDRVSGLREALTFARMYQPAVVFAEDVDRAVSGDDRTVEIDDILNTIDGIESKGSEVITILTSNNATNINRAMIRPGRLDAIIPVQAPDAKAVEKLLRLYGRGLIEKDTDLSMAGKELQGQIPAVIREVVERSKLYAISRAKGGKIKLNGEDIAHSARGMKNHLKLLNPEKESPKNRFELLGESLAEVVEFSVKRNGLYDGVLKTRDTATEILQRLQ